MPRVDVIIPFYNVRIDYTREALASVIAQTFTEWRAIVVNDGSEGSSTAALKSLIAEFDDARIVYVHQQNRGLSGARNTGIRLSDSPYIALLDADDAWLPNKLERQVQVLDSRRDVTVVHSGTHLVYPDRTILHQSGVSPCRGELSGERFFLRMLRKNIVSGTNTAVFSRWVAERVGLFDEAFASVEDKEFWLRLIIDGAKFLYLDEPLAIYRQHATNMSKNTDKMREGRLRLIRKLDTMIPRLPSSWTNVNWPELRRQMLQHVYIEAAESCIDAGQFGRAMKYSMPWYSGMSSQAGLLMARSAYRMVRSAANFS
jgi:glycosyltransferase involved in cell wall biosynthesis